MEFLFIIICLGGFIISIILLIKWWRMADDIKSIKNNVAGVNNDLAYFAALDDREQLEKAAKRILADKLYSAYNNQNGYVGFVTSSLDAAIKPILTQINNLGIQVPDHLKSGNAFLTFIDAIKQVNPTEEKPADSGN